MGQVTAIAGGALAYSLASGQKIYPFNTLTTSRTTVAAANPSRQRITFHNPGTVDIFIAPLFVQTNGSDVAFAPTTAALGGCFRVFANGGSLTLEGECNKGWQAFAASGAGNPLTVMDSNT